MLLSGNYPHRGTDPFGTWVFGGHSQFTKYESKEHRRGVAQRRWLGTTAFGKWHRGKNTPKRPQETKAPSSHKQLMTGAYH